MKYKISNWGIPVSFSGLRQDGKCLVPNGGTEMGQEVGWFSNARDREISKFSRKKFGTQKMKPGTQISSGHQCIQHKIAVCNIKFYGICNIKFAVSSVCKYNMQLLMFRLKSLDA